MEETTKSKTISTVNTDQHEIIRQIIKLHSPNKKIDCDPTYSKGNFYKKGVEAPAFKFDIDPLSVDVVKSSCDSLPMEPESIETIMFDPPFTAGSHNEGFKTGIIKDRFGYTKTIPELWSLYRRSLKEFHRVLKPGGIVIFKCQDTVDSAKQWFSHNEVFFLALEAGFYPLDLFILVAKNRICHVPPEKQRHGRKFHSYFWVFRKQEHKIPYGKTV